MKNLTPLLVGILLGVFGLAVYRQVIPWQKLSLDKIYRQSQNTPKVLTDKDIASYDAESKAFLQSAFDAMNTYRLGNNKFMAGLKASITNENGFGDVTKLYLDNQIYEAKEYFGKMIADLDLIETNYSDTTHIKRLFIQAAQLRVDGIVLISKGLLLKQERGQIRLNNMMNSPMPIPSYNGEVEDGFGKIKIANAYFVDALRFLKAYRDALPNLYDGNTFPDSLYDDYIKYYTVGVES